MVREPVNIELGAITQWLSGGTPSRSNEHYWSGEIPWISAFTLKKIEVTESDQCVSEEAVAAGSKMAPINSTLLLVRGSALHNEIRAGIVCKPVCFNQDVKALVPTKNVYPKYLTYSILGRENDLLKLVSSAGNTAGVLDTKLVQSFCIWLPDYEEQRSIANVLSDVDALLEELDNLIAKKRNLKQAVMQKLLTGQTRLPGFEGEWESVVLGTVVDLLTGYPFPSEKYQMSGIRLLRGSNIKRGETDWSEELVQYWPEVTHDLQQYMLKEGDIVIAMDGSLVGQSFARVSNDDLPALLLQRVARVRSSKIDMSYLKEWICSDFFTKHCDAHKTVTAIPHISPGDIRCFSIQVPPTIDEQVEIAEILSGMDSEIKAIEKCRKKTVSVKQAMMQELLTGRTRLI